MIKGDNLNLYLTKVNNCVLQPEKEEEEGEEEEEEAEEEEAVLEVC